MNVLKPLNKSLEKWIFIILPILMSLGIILGGSIEHLTYLTPYLFMILTFISSFSADWRKLGELIMKPWLFIIITVILHFAFPFLALMIVNSIFADDPELTIGIILAMMLPIGVTSIFWVGFVKGNVTTALSLVSLNTILSPMIIPLTLYLMLDSVVQVDTGSLIFSLLKLVLIPSTLGMAAGEWLRRNKTTATFMISTSMISKLCLYLVVLFNSASISSNLELVSDKILILVLVLFSLMVIGYLINFGISRFFYTDLETRIAIAYSGGIRNYTVGVVLATTFFSPLTVFPVLLAMLLQHPVAILFNLFFTRLKRIDSLKLNAKYQSKI